MYFPNDTSISTPKKASNIFWDYLTNDRDIVKTTKKIEYYNVPCSFDIEFTSFVQDGEKRSIMYAWTFGLNGHVIFGRTWDEFLTLYDTLVEMFELGLTEDDDNVNKKRDVRLICYCHNLAAEFQHMRHLLQWRKVFAIDVRKPLYALTNDGVEFRCSYLLSGYSLAKCGENLTKYPVKKLVGDLDYNKLRHSETPMTDREIQYCAHDVRVVMNMIQEKIEQDGNISKIPLTNTGYVRNYCRNKCLYGSGKLERKNQYRKYHKLMQALTLTPKEYLQSKRAFAGGFTHANACHADRVRYNVASFDFTSSYPYTMIGEQFPMSAGETIKLHSETEFYFNMRLYCCMFDIEIWGLESTTFVEHPLSFSKCKRVEKPFVDNGRLVSCDYCITTWTEQDFLIMSKFYTWDKIRIHNFRRYKRGYLPKEFVMAILVLYGDKTQLKGIPDKLVEYMHSKGMINASYGMTVTDICKSLIQYTNDWQEPEKPDVEKNIEKYNNSHSRFLFYLWGVWVTAYARKNLFTAINEFQGDYIYSDTDSVKVLNYEKHMPYIHAYNAVVMNKLERAMKHHNLPFELCAPKTIKGETKPLGVWDFEGVYIRFKTLGAKRYMTEQYNKKTGKIEISLTVSGLNKEYAIPYLKEKYCSHTAIFNHFNNDLYFPPCATGKKTHTYIDTPVEGYLTDYTGKRAYYYETSGLHLSGCDYTMSIAAQYADYIKGLRTKEN